MAPHPTGVGGAETINTTHFIGAVYGVERIMGRTANPVCPTLSAGKRIVVTGMCRRHQRCSGAWQGRSAKCKVPLPCVPGSRGAQHGMGPILLAPPCRLRHDRHRSRNLGTSRTGYARACAPVLPRTVCGHDCGEFCASGARRVDSSTSHGNRNARGYSLMPLYRG